MADGRVVIEAILDAANIPKQIKGLKKELNGITWKNIKDGDEKAKALSGAFKSAGKACTIGLTAPITAAGAAAFSVASNYENATARIQSAFGCTREEAEKFKDIGAKVYEGGWGESLDEVTSALIQTRSTIRDIDDNGLEKVTQTALMLSSTFDADVNESIRGTNALMEGFGLSAEEASDLLTAGMQRGLNYTDELGDNLSEYSVRWGEAGMSASMYFSLLEAGTANGAYNLDKVGDFLNEFLTSLTDGRMDEGIKNFSSGTQDVFKQFKAGKATAEDVLQAVLKDMQGMTDETKRAQIASELWSSLGEDNAMGMILALGGVSDSFGDVAGASQAAADAASDSFDNKMNEATRTVMGSLESFGEPLLNIAKGFADVAKAAGDFLSSIPPEGQTVIVSLLGILAALGPVLSMVGNAIPVITALSGVLSGVGGVVKGLGGALGALANPVTIVIAVIGLLVAAVIWLWDNCEEFRNIVTTVWEAVQAVIGAVVEWFTGTAMPAIQGFIDGVVQFFQGLGETISNIWNGIMSVINTVVSAIASFISAYLTTISTIWNTIWTAVWTTASNIWNGISSTISTVINAVWSVISSVVNGISSTIGSVFNAIWSTVSSIWNGIKNTISSVINAAWSVVSGVVNGIRNTISNVFNGIKSVVTTVWNGIKSAIVTPIEAAKGIVGGIIDAIKGFFNFKISWPHIPMPHFGINPSGWQIGDLLKGVIPSLKIDWYAKGAVFNGASIVGVGEAGPERVQPLSGPIAEAYDEKLADKVASRQSIDWVRLEAIIEAVLLRLASQLTIEVDGRQFGRVVRRYV